MSIFEKTDSVYDKAGKISILTMFVLIVFMLTAGSIGLILGRPDGLVRILETAFGLLMLAGMAFVYCVYKS